jgi:hypothetical protein
MNIGFKLGAISTSVSVAALFLVPSTAMAVPGWAQTSRALGIPASGCKNSVQNAIQRVTGNSSSADQLNGTTYLMTTYPQGTTGVFIYCVSNPEKAGGQASSMVLVLHRFVWNRFTSMPTVEGGSNEQIAKPVVMVTKAIEILKR